MTEAKTKNRKPATIAASIHNKLTALDARAEKVRDTCEQRLKEIDAERDELMNEVSEDVRVILCAMRGIANVPALATKTTETAKANGSKSATA